VTVTHAQDIIVDACMVAKFGIWGAHAKFWKEILELIFAFIFNENKLILLIFNIRNDDEHVEIF
jgi:hypothetical protein